MFALAASCVSRFVMLVSRQEMSGPEAPQRAALLGAVAPSAPMRVLAAPKMRPRVLKRFPDAEVNVMDTPYPRFCREGTAGGDTGVTGDRAAVSGAGVRY